MTFDEIRFALVVNGVEDSDVIKLLEYSKKNGTNYEVMDDMLIGMGYQKVFTDEFFGWIDSDIDEYDDEYFSTEKIPHRHEWDE